MTDMPEKIYARYLITGTHGIVCEKEGMYHGRGGLNVSKTAYIRHDLYEALEAQNKMLAEAIKKALIFGVSNGAEVVLNDALAQQIG